MRVALRRFPLCDRAELQRAGYVTRWLDELRDEVTAVVIDGRVIARSSVCPHFGGEFAVDVAGGRMRCKWHAWEFDIRSGRCLSDQLKACLREYDTVEEENGAIAVVFDV